MKEPLERDIQRVCVEHARRAGWDACKFGENGNPDYILFGPGGRVILVEFKSYRGRLRALQAKRIARLANSGHTVLVVRGAEGRDTFKAAFPDFGKGVTHLPCRSERLQH